MQSYSVKYKNMDFFGDMRAMILKEKKAVLLKIKVKPNAPRDKFMGIMTDGVCRIEISSPPEKGRANQALIKYLSKSLMLDDIQVSIKTGKNTSRKIIKIVRN
jgi:uncharacterized protein (TIGR00251 family)